MINIFKSSLQAKYKFVPPHKQNIQAEKHKLKKLGQCEQCSITKIDLTFQVRIIYVMVGLVLSTPCVVFSVT